MLSPPQVLCSVESRRRVRARSSIAAATATSNSIDEDRERFRDHQRIKLSYRQVVRLERLDNARSELIRAGLGRVLTDHEE